MPVKSVLILQLFSTCSHKNVAHATPEFRQSTKGSEEWEREVEVEKRWLCLLSRTLNYVLCPVDINKYLCCLLKNKHTRGTTNDGASPLPIFFTPSTSFPCLIPRLLSSVFVRDKAKANAHGRRTY